MNPRTYLSMLVCCGLLGACSSYHDEFQPTKVTSTTIEQAMGIAPKIRPAEKQTASPSQSVPARESRQPSTTVAQLDSQSGPKKLAPAAPTKAAPPTTNPAARILVHVRSANRRTGKWVLDIASEQVSEDDMIGIIPYLPALFGSQPPMTGFEYLNGKIIVAERCVDEATTNDPGCPAFESSIEIIAAFAEQTSPDMIPTDWASEQLQTFGTRMQATFGSFEMIRCSQPLAVCAR